MKPHRQMRHSNRVSSETGTANGAEAPSNKLYTTKLESIISTLRTLPPAERKRAISDAIKAIQGEDTQP